MRRKLAITLLAVNTMLASQVAWGCETPKSQCQDGSARTRTQKHKEVYEECHNGEWVKVSPPKKP